MFAERWFPDLVGWGAGALAIDAGACSALVLKLDANYLESAATISQKVYERIRRSKQGGGIAMPVGAGAGRLRLPRLPWLAGAGPVAWRQLLIAIRTSRHLLDHYDDRRRHGRRRLAVLAGGGPRPRRPVLRARVRHRHDVLHDVPLLDAAPLGVPGRSRPHRVPEDAAAASRVPGGRRAGRRRPAPDGIQLVLFGVLTAAAPAGWPLMLAAAAFCLPFNGLTARRSTTSCSCSTRCGCPTGTTFDFQMFGKMMLFLFLQFLLLIPLLGIPAALGGAAYFLAGYSWPAFVVTAWLRARGRAAAARPGRRLGVSSGSTSAPRPRPERRRASRACRRSRPSRSRVDCHASGPLEA